jgi:hypothetical protein
MVVGVTNNGVIVPTITVFNVTGTSGQTVLAGTFGENVFDYGGLYGDNRYPFIFCTIIIFLYNLFLYVEWKIFLEWDQMPVATFMWPCVC